MEKNSPEIVQFMRQIKHDKQYAMKMIEEEYSWSLAVDLIYNNGIILYEASEPDKSSYREFADFVEGNGYKVIRSKDTRFEGMIKCEITVEHV